MPPLMLQTQPPEYWARTAPREELLAAARAVPAWTDELAEIVDHAYVERSLRLLARAPDREAVAKLGDDLLRVAHDRDRPALERLERPYFARWRMLGELLLRAGQRAELPTSVLARKHVRELLRAIHDAGGRIAQASLGRIIANAGQLSATLALMQDWDLIERVKRGVANTVELTDLGRLAIAPELEATEAAAEAAPSIDERYIGLMSLSMGPA